MPWTIDGTRIFVNESKEDAGQIVPRLQPLGGATVLQTFGYESGITNLSALIVGDVDRDAIKLLRTTGLSYVLESPEYPVPSGMGEYTVKSVSISRESCICQTIRPDLDTDAPVYRIELQLYE